MIDTVALREKVLDLAIRGKLVPQDPNDEPASVLLERIREQKRQMVKDGKLKAKDIKDDSVIFVGDDNLHYEKFADGTVKCIEEEIPFELPKGWLWVRLQSVCQKEIKRGKAPTYIEKSGTLVFAQKCNTKSGQINMSLAQYLDESKIHKYPLELFTQYGDIIINSTGTGTLGRIGIFEQSDDIKHLPIIPDSHITTVRVFPELVQKYIFIFLKAHQSYFENSGEGSTNQKELRPDVVKSFIVAIPPFNEQIRIVEKFEAISEIVRQLNANSDSFKRTISSIKAKILDLAIRGRLVPQDPNDEPASVLLDRIRAEKEELIRQGKIKRDKKESIIFKGEDNSYYEKLSDGTVKCIDEEIPCELPQGWAWCRLNGLSDSCANAFVDGPFGSNLKTEHYTPNREVRIIQLNNIGEFAWKNAGVKYTTFKHAETLDRCITYPDDIVIAKMMPAGRAIIVPKLESMYVISSDCVRLRAHKHIYNKYLMYTINSAIVNGQVQDSVHGIGRSRTSLSKCKELLIPVPPFKEQTCIVDGIETAYKQLSTIKESL